MGSLLGSICSCMKKKTFCAETAKIQSIHMVNVQHNTHNLALIVDSHIDKSRSLLESTARPFNNAY